MRLSALGASVALALGCVTAVATPAAAADSTYYLSTGNVPEIVVDEAHGHVYIAGGRAGTVLVRDLEGNEVTTITGQRDASGLALSPDGSVLYVANAHADAISAIDTTTLTEVARYPTGTDTCPASTPVVGRPYRFRSYFDGNVFNLASSSSYLHVKFT